MSRQLFVGWSRFIFFQMTACSQKLKCHFRLQRSKLIFHYQADVSVRQTSCSVCDWLFIRLTNTHAANTNTYCTLLTCLSWDCAVVLFDYLTHMSPKTNVSAVFTDAHTRTHTQPSGCCISCLQTLRSYSAIVTGRWEFVSSWVHGGSVNSNNSTSQFSLCKKYMSLDVDRWFSVGCLCDYRNILSVIWQNREFNQSFSSQTTNWKDKYWIMFVF